MSDEKHYVAPSQLCVGLYVHLDLGWMEHPFTFSNFKIKSDEQIATLRGLGLSRIRYEPGRSSVKPLPLPAPSMQADEPVVAPVVVVDNAAIAEKKARLAQLQDIKQGLRDVEAKFHKAADSIKAITRMVHGQPEQARAEADGLVTAMVETMAAAGDVKIHAINEQLGEDVYFHSLNVTVLSMILGKALNLPLDQMHQLGLGALFHDIGHTALPSTILSKASALTRPEQALYETHCAQGLKIAQKLGLAPAALAIVQQHHECVDGSGYPMAIKGEAISPLAKIVAIVNSYDNLCNPNSVGNAVTPSDALSQMFAFKRGKFDETMLRLFIRCLGVYPPGSIVQLSNDMIGLVLSVNPQASLKPTVLVYDPNIPRDEAVIVDLHREADLKIARSMRAALLPRDVYQYLSPRKHVTYYFDPQQAETQA